MPEMTGWEAVVLAMKAEGRAVRLRASRRPAPPLRRPRRRRARRRSPPGRRPLRDLRRVHGHGLRPRDEPARRLLRLSRSRHRQPGPRHPGGALRLHPDARPRRALPAADLRQGIVPGNRPPRHALLDHEVGHHCRTGGEYPLGHAPRRPARHQRPTGSGLRRAPRRHRPGRVGHPRVLALVPRTAPCPRSVVHRRRRRPYCRRQAAAAHHRGRCDPLRRRQRREPALSPLRHRPPDDTRRPRLGGGNPPALLRPDRSLPHDIPAPRLRSGRSDHHRRFAHGGVPGRIPPLARRARS